MNRALFYINLFKCILLTHHLTGDDYNNASKTIRIPDGLTYDEFEIEITDDDDYEDSETFFVTIDPLSLPYGVTLGSNAYAEVTILDNDSK